MGGVDAWPDSTFKNEYEYNYVEVNVLIVLLLLALTFESIWHHVQRYVRQNAYYYGSLHDGPPAEAESSGQHGGGGPQHPRARHVHGKHVKLAEELVNRAGGEFMTLGFLAFCTFMFNTLGGFKWLVATCPPSGSVPLPATEVDWLHLVELVHMKLFVGMVFYFALISRIVAGAIRKIRKWEQMQLRYARGQTINLNKVALAVDRDLTEYLVWRSYFIQRLVATEDRRPALYRALFRELGVCRKAPDAQRRLREKIERCFSFSAYISLNVEIGVRDCIEVHQLTWFGTILLFGLFAVLHRFAHVSLKALTPIFIGAALIILGTMRFTVTRNQQRIFKATCTDGSPGPGSGVPPLQHSGSVSSMQGDYPTSPPSPSVPEDSALGRDDLGPELEVQMRTQSSGPKGPDQRHFHERWQTEMIMNRLLQILLYLISYVFARTVMDFHDWAERPEITGLLTLLFLVLFALLVYFLPPYVPVFLGVMALPPYVDDGNLAAFFGVIDQTRSKDEEAPVDETIAREQSLVPTTASVNGGSEGWFRGVSEGSSCQTPPELFGLIGRLERRLQALEDRAPFQEPQSSAWRRAGGVPPGAAVAAAAAITEEAFPQSSAWRQALARSPKAAVTLDSV